MTPENIRLYGCDCAKTECDLSLRSNLCDSLAKIDRFLCLVLDLQAFLEELILNVSRDKDINITGGFVTKLNEVLIEIVKREWPHNWPNFISQVVSVSKKSEAVCMNNIRLLRTLCEEASQNISSDLTQAEQERLKRTLKDEFEHVFQLCKYVLTNSENERLIVETLKTLCEFLRMSWIPLSVIFNTDVMEGLCKFYANRSYRSHCLECMAEIANITKKQIAQMGGDVTGPHNKMVSMYLATMKISVTVHAIKDSMDFSRIMDESEFSRIFFHNLCNFLCSFFTRHHSLLEQTSDTSRKAFGMGLKLLVALTNTEDKTLTAVCLDYWEFLSNDLKTTLPRSSGARVSDSSPTGWVARSGSRGGFRGGDDYGPVTQYELSHPRYQLYHQILPHLKRILMSKLPRPKEVLIVKDEFGNEIREEMKHTERLYIHSQMTRILFNLSSVDPSDTSKLIVEKLESVQKNIHHINFDELNSLCWSIGAVANAMTEGDEKTFLVNVIKILLQLCEKQRSKDAKAIIAACIMYVVRKYPKFLRKHWKFLQTVVKKLIEFLAEIHPGVQDMAIDTLDEICQQTGFKFTSPQKDERNVFWLELMDLLHGRKTLSDGSQIVDARDPRIRGLGYTGAGQIGIGVPMTEFLSKEQIENLYGTWSIIIHKTDKRKQVHLLNELLEVPNQKWTRICDNAKRSGMDGKTDSGMDDDSYLMQPNTVQELIHVLKIFKSVCLNGGGQSFIAELGRIFDDFLHIYNYYAQSVSRSISDDVRNLGSPQVKGMRMVKAQILQLMETFVSKCSQSDEKLILERFVPGFLETVLTDYEMCEKQVKEYSCLNASCALIERFGPGMERFVGLIFKSSFQTTLDLLRGSLQEMPDHRRAFFRLLKAVTERCFDTLKKMNAGQLKMLIHSLLWGLEHIDSVICQTASLTMIAFLNQMRVDANKQYTSASISSSPSDSSSASSITMPALIYNFYRTFAFGVIEKIVKVMTDALHKQSFNMICEILRNVCLDVSNDGLMRGPLWDQRAEQFRHVKSNVEYLCQCLTKILHDNFPNLSKPVIDDFNRTLFEIANDTKDKKINIDRSNILSGVDNGHQFNRGGSSRRGRIYGNPHRSSSEWGSGDEDRHPFLVHCRDLLVRIKQVHESGVPSGVGSSTVVKSDPTMAEAKQDIMDEL